MSLASTTSSTTTVGYLDNVGVLLSWTGTSPVGAITFDVSNDNSNWVSLDFGSVIAISGNTGSHVISINQLPFIYIRAKYTKTSGTGTLTASLNAKQVGG